MYCRGSMSHKLVYHISCGSLWPLTPVASNAWIQWLNVPLFFCMWLLLERDLCSSGPCFNKGTCIDTEDSNYKCLCMQQWIGNQCEGKHNAQLSPNMALRSAVASFATIFVSLPASSFTSNIHCIWHRLHITCIHFLLFRHLAYFHPYLIDNGHKVCCHIFVTSLITWPFIAMQQSSPMQPFCVTSHALSSTSLL